MNGFSITLVEYFNFEFGVCGCVIGHKNHCHWRFSFFSQNCIRFDSLDSFLYSFSIFGSLINAIGTHIFPIHKYIFNLFWKFLNWTTAIFIILLLNENRNVTVYNTNVQQYNTVDLWMKKKNSMGQNAGGVIRDYSDKHRVKLKTKNSLMDSEVICS